MQNLLQKAKSDGMDQIEIILLIERGGYYLLLQKDEPGDAIFEFPADRLKDAETLEQGIDRLLVENTNLKIAQLKRLLTYFDENHKRIFAFIAIPLDPDDVFLRYHKAYSWIDPKEAAGYPLEKHTRECLKILLKFTM